MYVHTMNAFYVECLEHSLDKLIMKLCRFVHSLRTLLYDDDENAQVHIVQYDNTIFHALYGANESTKTIGGLDALDCRLVGKISICFPYRAKGEKKDITVICTNV